MAYDVTNDRFHDGSPPSRADSDLLVIDLTIAAHAIERAATEVRQAHDHTWSAVRLTMALAGIDLETASKRIATALVRRRAEL